MCQYQDVYYKSGDGTNQEENYLKQTAGNGTEFHSVKLSTGETVKTVASHLQLMEQTDLTNIPPYVKTYCKEVESGVTEVDISQMSHPKSLSPLQQQMLYDLTATTKQNNTITFLLDALCRWQHS